MAGYPDSDHMDLQSAPLHRGGEPPRSEASGRVHPRRRDSVLGTRSPRDCDIRLTLPARPENVAVVRRVVGALADCFALPPAVAEDVRLAVTEACSNVVRHAYRGQEGTLEVRVEARRGGIDVVVCDRGTGIQPNPESEGPGLGLPLIAALSTSLEIEQSPGNGSALFMSFRADRAALEAA